MSDESKDTLLAILADVGHQASKVKDAATKIESFSDKLQDQSNRIIKLEMYVNFMIRIFQGTGAAILLAVLAAVLKLVIKQ